MTLFDVEDSSEVFNRRLTKLALILMVAACGPALLPLVGAAIVLAHQVYPW